jgi:hypothetical protein
VFNLPKNNKIYNLILIWFLLKFINYYKF